MKKESNYHLKAISSIVASLIKNLQELDVSADRILLPKKMLKYLPKNHPPLLFGLKVYECPIEHLLMILSKPEYGRYVQTVIL